MSKNPVRKMPPAAGRTSFQKIEMDRFARKLHQLMIERGMSQSDLARKAFGVKTDARGYDVARKRDRISVYLKGASIPDPVNLQKLAEALGVDISELAPDIQAATIDRENPEVALTAIAGHNDKVHLQVNKLLPMSLAAKIVGMIADYDEPANAD
jgi:transcriptional regulator with XRE-family HTH domain